MSTDGGKSWSPAALEPEKDPCAWILFSYDWVSPPGTHEIIVRATDKLGRTQPEQRDPALLAGYVNNWWHRKSLSVPV